MSKFLGLTDKHWNILKSSLPAKPPKNWIGRRPQDFRPILNSIFWILITGARWCDLPIRKNFAKKSTAHFWLGRWQDDGTLDKVLYKLHEQAQFFKIIDLSRLSVDGFFSLGKRRRKS